MCRESFATVFAEGQPTDRAASRIASAHPNCGCEAHSVSEHSLGPVAPAERISRLAFSPRQFDLAENRPLPGLFEDVYRHGASALRSDALEARVLHTRGLQMERERHAVGKTEIYVGFCSAGCDAIRRGALDPDDQNHLRQVCIYDTASEQVPEHVDLMGARAVDKLARQRIRNELVKIFSGDVALADRTLL
jgi:hypothetical protein